MTNLFRFNPFLIIRKNSKHNGLLFENPLDKTAFILNDVDITKLFEISNEWTELHKLEINIAKYLNLNREEAKLLCKNITVKKSPEFERLETAYSLWDSYNWKEPFIYLLATKDYPFYDRVENYDKTDYTTMKRYSEKSDVPDIYKIYQNSKIKLPHPTISDTSIEDALEAGSYAKGQADLKSISNILFYTFGKTGIIRFPVLGESLLKTSPSGGSRHPTEAYVYYNNEKLNGLFHYSVKEHLLECIKGGDHTNLLKKLLFEFDEKYLNFDPKAIIFITSLFERNMWRYREPRTFRSVFFDMGHVIETLSLLCKSYGLKAHISYGFNSKKLEKFIGLDGFKEGVFYCVIIGT